MTFTDSVSNCFRNYVSFDDRASRSEYWWFTLFCFLANLVAGFVDAVGGTTIFTYIVSLGLFLPSLSVAVRRCHDTDHFGLWVLCPIYNFVLMLLPGDEKANKYGTKAY